MDKLNCLHEYISNLKDLKRKGWVIRGIPNPESVADHSYSVCFLALIMAKENGLNTDKCLKLALIHDLAEAIASDFTPKDKEYSKKNILEKKAIKKIVEKTGYPFIEELWEEYEENKTKEARLVHDLDKIEMIMQAKYYKKKFPDKDLEEFFLYVKGKLFFEESKKLYEDIIASK